MKDLDTTLLETFLQHAAQQQDLQVSFKLAAKKAHSTLHITHQKLKNIHMPYQRFMETLNPIAANNTYYDNHNNYFAVGEESFNPNIHMNLTEESLKTINTEIRQACAIQMPDDFFIEMLNNE